ncbi:MAG: SWIM zinc finger family protein [Defluviitaleaceae bacterium]|nr:SWIM zinc finger family protein [Defluviitaleaceae bacterium]
MSLLRTQLSGIDENYLVNLANKGLVNRAGKELVNTEININLTDSALEAVFADGTIVTIQDILNNFTCTCPSRNICKHVVMALMETAIRTETEGIPGQARNDVVAEVLPGFEYLLDYTQDALIKEWGKKLYDDALSRVLGGQIAKIKEGQRLIVSITDEGVSVSILPGSGLNQALCTCKTKGCAHQLEALFQYIQYKTGELNFELTISEFSGDLSVIPHAMALVEDIYRIGLFRLPGEYGSKCSQYATLCHGAGFATLERLFETCGRQLSLYEAKNAGFNLNSLVHSLGIIYRICSAQDVGTLAGRFKRQYRGLPKIHILGIGAYPWYAGSGFCGVTAVFYCPELGRCLTFGLSRPVESEAQAVKLVDQIWKDKSTWGLHTSLDGLAKGEWSLSAAKISDNDRLSSSESTKGSIINGRTDLDGEEIGGIIFDNFTKLKELFTHEDGEFAGAYAIIKPARIEKGQFDRVTQEYKLPIYDKNDNCLHMTVAYSQINESILHYCEEIKTCPEAISVKMTISQEHFAIKITPFAFWAKGDINNLGKDLSSFRERKGQSYFARFFAPQGP